MNEQKNVLNWDKEVAAEIKELVRLSGLTRWKIAEEIGIAEGTLSNILAGKQMPSMPVVKLLSQVLGEKGPRVLELTGIKAKAS